MRALPNSDIQRQNGDMSPNVARTNGDRHRHHPKGCRMSPVPAWLRSPYAMEKPAAPVRHWPRSPETPRIAAFSRMTAVTVIFKSMVYLQFPSNRSLYGDRKAEKCSIF